MIDRITIADTQNHAKLADTLNLIIDKFNVIDNQLQNRIDVNLANHEALKARVITLETVIKPAIITPL
uniref:Uncharacterized protein n=1 Tax=viral metagenome TaxID=1070528 RepID=A0A6M3IW60_9ZZZZ